MTLRADPVVLHLRGYADGVDIDKPLADMTEPYRYSCIAVLLDNGQARIEGLNEKITHADRREIVGKLAGFGVKRLTWRHKSKEISTDTNHGP